MMTTLYEVLGCKEDASPSEIEEAYLNIIKFYQYKDSMVGKSKRQAISY
jgi:DnaJ-class molecular chaperone